MLSTTKTNRLNYFSFACISLILIIAVAFTANDSRRAIVKAGNQSEYSLSCTADSNRIGGSYDSTTTKVSTSLGNDVYLSTKGLYMPYDTVSTMGQFRLSADFGSSGLIYNSSSMQNLSALKIKFHAFGSYQNNIQASLYLSASRLDNPVGDGYSLVSDVEFPISGDYQYFAIKVTSDFASDYYENMIVVVDSLDIDYACGSSYVGDSFDYAFKDGEVILESGTLPTGAVIPMPSETPSKDEDDDFTYSFVGYEGYAEGMRIYDDVEFVANFKSLAKDPYALMNANNTLQIDVGARAKNTAVEDEFVFKHSSAVSNISTASQWISNYVEEFEGTYRAGDATNTITLPSYSRTINMMITGTGSASPEEATHFGGVYLYAGFERESTAKGYVDPIGSARNAAKKPVKIWNSTYNIENLIFRDIVFHTRGATFQYGLALDYLNDPTSSIGYVRNIVFENCVFEDISSPNDGLYYTLHTNAGGCINFLNTRNSGSIDILGNVMTNLTLFEGSALSTRGLKNMTLAYNDISNIAYAIWMHSGYGITGSIEVSHNRFANTGSRLLRINTKQNHNLFENDNASGTMKIINNQFIHAITSTSFLKIDNENTTSPVLPYQYEENGRIILDVSNEFYFASETPLNAIQLADGSKNCGTHSGAGSTTYIDGLYILSE